MQFNPLFLSLAATFALVQAGPVAAPHEARAALENRQAGCLQGSCLDCTQYCYERDRTAQPLCNASGAAWDASASAMTAKSSWHFNEEE
ncbi:hypothetical protein QBC35DRAFT_551928 [Podospora australis]|uniref:Uncharacterized protein n=1 Tax=Podospora australis TaxID=1536484 RepID=A0AAN6WSC7_9PEZI|nr:hypothetical protein QBC35DRAFT_551928 [Podospora australis]